MAMDIFKMLGIDKDQAFGMIGEMTELAKATERKISNIEAIMPRLRDALLDIDKRLAAVESQTANKE
jgi:hypothetical protein